MKSALEELADFRDETKAGGGRVGANEELVWALARINELKEALTELAPAGPRTRLATYSIQEGPTMSESLRVAIRDAERGGLVLAWCVAVGGGTGVANFVGAESVWVRR